MLKTYGIYALSDPRTGEIRYVGKARFPKRRLSGHLSDARRHADRGNPALFEWIRALARIRKKPQLCILEIVEGPAALESEWVWMCKLAGSGRLLNRMRPVGKFCAMVMMKTSDGDRLINSVPNAYQGLTASDAIQVLVNRALLNAP